MLTFPIISTALKKIPTFQYQVDTKVLETYCVQIRATDQRRLNGVRRDGIETARIRHAGRKNLKYFA